MRRHGGWIALLVLFALGAPASPAADDDRPDDPIPLRIRPFTLAQNIEEFAGQPVVLSGARAVGMFGSRVLVIDTATRIQAALRHRDRVLVLVEHGAIHVDPELLVGSTVRVTGVARTLLGVQLTREVPWPVELDRDRIKRLEIRAAVLATSVETADGVELTDRSGGNR